MASTERLTLSKTIGSAVGEIVGYPFTHPKETARTVVVGGLAVASTLIASQVTMLIAEHGGIRSQREELPAAAPTEAEEPHEQQ